MAGMPGPRLAFGSRTLTPMIMGTALSEDAGRAAMSLPDLPDRGLGLLSLLILSTWCGLVAGLLEVGTIVVRKRWFDPNPLYEMSRHFVWLIPVTNLVLFVSLGVLGFALGWAWPARGRWLMARTFCALTLLPAALVAFPGVYSVAWLAVGLGVASRVVPLLERRAAAFRRLVLVTFPLLAGAVVIMAAAPWALDRINQSREDARSLPAAGSPNVLLVVMDTVAAGHLGMQGYPRPTSTTLDELAERGVRFESARSASPWTLSSHATMFTGRWLHELSVGWYTPLDGTYPTLAEFLGDQGYATAAFVANYTYCARDSGLARGFTRYQDFIFPELTCFKMSVLLNRALSGLQVAEDLLERELEFAQFRPYLKYLWRLLDTDRKGAAVINRQFVDWLSERRQTERPFFAFLNYFDAHSPYQLSAGRMHRFGAVAIDNAKRDLIQNWWDLDKRGLSPGEIAFAVDSYDECVADLDEQLGELFDELERRGVLGKTWLIVVSDHGESFGEHSGVFCHGTSLYQTEIHVPLLIVPPGGMPSGRVVKKTVSLRDLAATIVELVAMADGSPFPGQSLAGLWKGQPGLPETAGAFSSQALAEVVPDDSQNHDVAGQPLKSWPLGGLADGEWSYIRREGNVREELFHLTDDKNEEHNQAGDAAKRAHLEQMRVNLKKLTAGPLTPDRFQP
jgi:arylsulfatase A-like enzyme